MYIQIRAREKWVEGGVDKYMPYAVSVVNQNFLIDKSVLKKV